MGSNLEHDLSNRSGTSRKPYQDALALAQLSGPKQPERSEATLERLPHTADPKELPHNNTVNVFNEYKKLLTVAYDDQGKGYFVPPSADKDFFSKLNELPLEHRKKMLATAEAWSKEHSTDKFAKFYADFESYLKAGIDIGKTADETPQKEEPSTVVDEQKGKPQKNNNLLSMSDAEFATYAPANQAIDPLNLNQELLQAAFFHAVNELRTGNLSRPEVTPESYSRYEGEKLEAAKSTISNESNQKPFSYSPELSASAQSHSDEMVKLNYYSHKSPVEGRTSPSDRIKISDYCAENIIWGCASEGNRYSVGEGGKYLDINTKKEPELRSYLELARHATEEWYKSAGHRINCMNPELTKFGIGVSFYQEEKTELWRYKATQNFTD